LGGRGGKSKRKEKSHKSRGRDSTLEPFVFYFTKKVGRGVVFVDRHVLVGHCASSSLALDRGDRDGDRHSDAGNLPYREGAFGSDYSRSAAGFAPINDDFKGGHFGALGKVFQAASTNRKGCEMFKFQTEQ
jgi:hypothetical protein